MPDRTNSFSEFFTTDPFKTNFDHVLDQVKKDPSTSHLYGLFSGISFPYLPEAISKLTPENYSDETLISLALDLRKAAYEYFAENGLQLTQEAIDRNPSLKKLCQSKEATLVLFRGFYRESAKALIDQVQVPEDRKAFMNDVIENIHLHYYKQPSIRASQRLLSLLIEASERFKVFPELKSVVAGINQLQRDIQKKLNNLEFIEDSEFNQYTKRYTIIVNPKDFAATPDSKKARVILRRFELATLFTVPQFADTLPLKDISDALLNRIFSLFIDNNFETVSETFTNGSDQSNVEQIPPEFFNSSLVANFCPLVGYFKKLNQDIKKAVEEEVSFSIHKLCDAEKENIIQELVETFYNTMVDLIIQKNPSNGLLKEEDADRIHVIQKLSKALMSFQKSQEKIAKELLNQLTFVLERVGRLKKLLDKKISSLEDDKEIKVERENLNEIKNLEEKIQQIKSEILWDVKLKDLSPLNDSYVKDKLDQFNKAMEKAIESTKGSLAQFLYDLWRKVTEVLRFNNSENSAKLIHPSSFLFFATQTAKELAKELKGLQEVIEKSSSVPSPGNAGR
jgi:hypothetical protein